MLLLLRNTVLKWQKHQCSTCGEPPEAHNFSYIHKRGKLSVVVKRLSPELLLSGEAKGKLWMWRLCLKCERENGIPKPTRRVMMSSLTHCLSFGKFLDLSIWNSTASSRLASCGHLLHRDCLQFYGYVLIDSYFQIIEVFLLSLFILEELFDTLEEYEDPNICKKPIGKWHKQ